LGGGDGGYGGWAHHPTHTTTIHIWSLIVVSLDPTPHHHHQPPTREFDDDRAHTHAPFLDSVHATSIHTFCRRPLYPWQGLARMVVATYWLTRPRTLFPLDSRSPPSSSFPGSQITNPQASSCRRRHWSSRSARSQLAWQGRLPRRHPQQHPLCRLPVDSIPRQLAQHHCGAA
jgi:hypothetical protein